MRRHYSFYSVSLCWNTKAWNVCPSWFLWQNSWKGDWNLCFFHVFPFSFLTVSLCYFFLRYLFIYCFASKCFGSHRCFSDFSIDFWVHFCNCISFHLFVLAGVLLLPHSFFPFLSPRMFLSNSKFFSPSSLPFSVFDVFFFSFYFLPSSSMHD